MRIWLAPLVLLATTAVPASAGASSIVYLRSGDIWRASPTGAHKEVVVRARGLTTASPPRGAAWGIRSTRPAPACAGTTTPPATCPASPARSTRRRPTAAGSSPAGDPRAARPRRPVRDPAGAEVLHPGLRRDERHALDARREPDRRAAHQRPRLAFVPARRHGDRGRVRQPPQGLRGLVLQARRSRRALLVRSHEPRAAPGPPQVTRGSDFIAVTTDRDNPVSKDDETPSATCPARRRRLPTATASGPTRTARSPG